MPAWGNDLDRDCNKPLRHGDGTRRTGGQKFCSDRAIVTEVLFRNPDDQHFFGDSSLASHDPGATALLTQRVLGFLSGGVARDLGPTGAV